MRRCGCVSVISIRYTLRTCSTRARLPQHSQVLPVATHAGCHSAAVWRHTRAASCSATGQARILSLAAGKRPVFAPQQPDVAEQPSRCNCSMAEGRQTVEQRAKQLSQPGMHPLQQQPDSCQCICTAAACHLLDTWATHHCLGVLELQGVPQILGCPLNLLEQQGLLGQLPKNLQQNSRGSHVWSSCKHSL